MAPIAGHLFDAAGDVLQAGDDGAPPGVDRVCSESGRVEKGLDLRLQV